MSVTACNVQGTDWTCEVDQDYRGTISVTYRVTCNSKSDGPQVVLAGARSASPTPLPQHYATYAVGNDSDPTLFARQFSVKPATQKGSHGMLWDVVVTYSPLDRKEPGDDNPVPTERPVKFGGSWESYDDYVTKDINADAIINNAGVEYNPPLVRPKHSFVLTARQNVGTLDEILSKCLQLFGTNELGTVNINEWRTIPAGQALFMAPSVGDLESVNGVYFYPVTWRFKIGSKPWKARLVERGGMILVGAATLGLAEDANHPGTFLPPPYYLDDDGTLLPDGETPIVTEWEIHEKVDFRTILGF